MKTKFIVWVWLMIFAFATQPVLAQVAPLPSKPAPEKVRLQLKWFNQFQFAGYFAAIEKGFYAEEGLDVEIKERILEKNFVKQVVSGESEYGVGDSGLVSQYAQGESITMLAAIFQHNPLVFFSRQDSGIVSPYEMIGKRVMSDIVSTNEAPLRAMLASANVTEKDYTLVQQINDYGLLTRRKVDVISGYVTDQPFYFRENGVKVNIINPQNYGVDFYGDILFTSQRELHDHPGRVERFKRASLKGWRYALDHPEELIQIIHKKYHSKLSIEHLRFEAEETRKLILPDVIPIGQIELNRMRKVADVYAGSGLNRPLSEADMVRLISSGKSSGLTLTEQEKTWLAAHPVIRVGIDRDFAPYEWIDKDGNYVGMAADYMQLLEKKLGVRFEIIKNQPWAEILEMAKRGELDMLSCVVKTAERSKYLSFTEPYKLTQAVIIDNGQGNFIGNLSRLDGKRVAVEKGYFMQELLEKNYPQIHLVLGRDTKEALDFVLEGKADVYVGDAGSVNYAIKKNGLLSLRFSGQTEFNSQHSVGFVKNNPELASIVVKAMASIPKGESDAIFNRWLGLRIEQGVKSETLVKYGLVVLGLFLLFAYWMYRLQREITERKNAEKKLVESQNYLQSIIDNEPECIKIVDEQGRLLQMNPAGLAMIEADSLEQVAGAPVSKLIAPEYRKAFANLHRRVLAGETAQLEFEVIGLKGGRRLLETHAVPMRAANGRIVHLAVTRDITERKHAEEQMLQARDAAEALAQSKTEFLANMSHEIRTPMNGIIGLSHLALNKEVSAEVRDYLEKINSSSESLLGVLNDILDFSKMEAGKLSIENVRFDLDTTLNNVRNLFAIRAEEKYLDFGLEIAPDTPIDLVGDALRLQQVLSNLIGNAIKFTEHGEVKVQVKLLGFENSHAKIRFSVQDTGIGMSRDDQSKLFQPFSQVDGSITRRFGGTGLGLAISHKLLQLMGSDFDVESTPGKGTTFSFDLLLGMASSESHHEVNQRHDEREAGTLAGNLREQGKPLAGRRILVAEDDTINQQVVKEFLKLSGVSVDVVNNGKEALQLLEKNTYDAILMDVHMPEMGGVEATEIIRSQPQYKAMPIIALTAGVTLEERNNCKASGMNDFLAKPINPEQLIVTLVQWVTPVASKITAQSPAENSAQPIAGRITVLDDLPGFDLNNLLAMLNNNLPLATQLLLAFAEDMKNMSAEITARIDEGDLASAMKMAHKIRGASGNVGAMRLHAFASALEAELKERHSNAATLNEFREAFDQAMATLATLRQSEAQSTLPSANLNTELLIQAARELDLLLEENDFVSHASLDALKSNLPPDKHELFARLRHAVNGIQYVEARRILRQIAELPDIQEPL